MIRILPNRDLSARVWHLAGPVVVGMISQTLLNIVDTAMVGRLGPTALAATGLGGVLAWTIMGAIGQLNIGAQAVSSRRFGEGKLHAAGAVLDNALLVAAVVGTFTSLILSGVMADLYHFFSDDPAVTLIGRDYIRLRLLGSLPFMVIMAHRGFFNGIGETYLHMRVAIVINVINAGLNWIFIFGNLGADAMGAKGLDSPAHWRRQSGCSFSSALVSHTVDAGVWLLSLCQSRPGYDVACGTSLGSQRYALAARNDRFFRFLSDQRSSRYG